MEIAHGQHVRRPGEIGTNLRPDLRPTVIGGTQEGKNRALHVAMFAAQISLDDVGVAAEPIFKMATRFNDVHRAQRYDQGQAKSTEEKAKLPRRHFLRQDGYTECFTR